MKRYSYVQVLAADRLGGHDAEHRQEKYWRQSCGGDGEGLCQPQYGHSYHHIGASELLEKIQFKNQLL